MSVPARPTDEAEGPATSHEDNLKSSSLGPPVARELEETREGGFSDKPAQPVNMAQTMPYTAGDVIANKYRLTRVLGEGGMGAVWLARNLALEIDVAIKLIRHDYANAEGAMRLLQEARAAARIGHPCIVRVFDFGTTERADPFIVMEVLQGESLAQALARKGKLSAISAVRTLLPVASALAAAHTKGIVHRDLKPDNIRLVTDERGAVIPKVVDFGIAKLHHDDIPRETTQAGVILGSPHYMSPEQACGRSDVDHRTDVWAFSVMLYEVITGKRPFEGPNYNALISSILVFHPAPWDQHDIHEPDLWKLVAKGLAKESDDRWQSMQEYGEVLATWASQRDVETDAAGNSLRAHWLAAATHRPLSEFPPTNGASSDPGRPRMVSERDIRIRMPSIPELAIPELVETNDPPAEAKASATNASSEILPPNEIPPLDEGSPTEEPPSTVASPPAPPSSLPQPTSASRPPERRTSALVIGPVALVIGAILAGGIMMATKDPPGQTDVRPAKSTTSLSQPHATNDPVLTVSSPVVAVSSAPESGPIVPVASVTPSASTVARPDTSSSAAPIRTTVPVVGPKTSTKTIPVPPPIPTEPNF